MSLKAKIEAVLFCSAKPIKAQSMARIVNADVQAVRQAMLELVHDYEERQGGLEIADEDGYSFQVKDEYANLMDEFLPVEMSHALIRTLSAIAIKQPIAQSEIIRVRGAGAYDHIKELVIRDLVSKKEEPSGGRSPMLTTTKKFQEYFRLTKDGKELRNFLKGAVKKAAAAAAAAADAEAAGQMLIGDVVASPETDEELNNRIFLETADMADAAAEQDDISLEPDTVAAVEVPPAETEEGTLTTAGTEQPSLEPDVVAAGESPLAEIEESGLPRAATEDISDAPVAEAVTEAPVAEAVTEAPVAEMVEPVTAAAEPVELIPAGEVEINASPEAEFDVPPPPVEGTRKKARKTLSKLAEAADVKQPEPLPAAEAEQETVKAAEESKSSDEETIAPTAPAGTPTKGGVQARSLAEGPETAPSDGNKKKPPMLADILKKQKDLERVFKREETEEVQQTKIDFGNVIEPTPPADKAS